MVFITISYVEILTLSVKYWELQNIQIFLFSSRVYLNATTVPSYLINVSTILPGAAFSTEE